MPHQRNLPIHNGQPPIATDMAGSGGRSGVSQRITRSQTDGRESQDTQRRLQDFDQSDEEDDSDTDVSTKPSSLKPLAGGKGKEKRVTLLADEIAALTLDEEDVPELTHAADNDGNPTNTLCIYTPNEEGTITDDNRIDHVKTPET